MKTKAQNSWFNKGLVILAILLITIGLIVLIKYLFFINKYATTNDAQIDQYVTPVTSRVTGYINDIKFEENQYVHKGDTLVIIDNQEFKNKLDIATADLKVSEENITVNEKSVSTSANNVNIHKSRLEAAKIQVWKTEQDYIRFKNLLAADAATQQQFEQVKAAYDSALAAYKTIELEASTASLNTSEQSAKLNPIKSTTKQKEAVVDNANLYLSYTVIKAPYNGWVSRKNIQIGQLIKEGQNIVNVISEEKWITANFRETQISDLEVGTKVKIKVDAYPKLDFTGYIQSFSPASGSKLSLIQQDNATGNFIKIEQRIPLKILFDKNQNIEKLRAGMNVVISAQKNN